MNDYSRPTIHLLVSSTSAGGRAFRFGRAVAEEMIRGGWSVEVTVSMPDDDPAVLARESSHTYVAALGGDGFVAAVAHGTHAAGKVLVPFPGGQGNDLCRAVGLSTDMVKRAAGLSLVSASEVQESPASPSDISVEDEDENGDEAATGASDWRTHIESRTLGLDAIRIEKEGQEDRMVLGLVSLGLDATANILANQSTMTGSFAYTYGAVKALMTYRPTPFTAIVDGEARDLEGWVLSLSNSGVFGGGVRLAAESDPTDGQFEMIHVGPYSMSRLLPALTRVLALRGSHPLVTSEIVHTVELTGPEGTVVMADGDPIATLPVRASLVPGFTRVLV